MPPTSDVSPEALADLSARLGLPIPPEYRDGVALHFARLMVEAEKLMAFSLEDSAEPAPVFRP
jgi:hypothetical protein